MPSPARSGESAAGAGPDRLRWPEAARALRAPDLTACGGPAERGRSNRLARCTTSGRGRARGAGDARTRPPRSWRAGALDRTGEARPQPPHRRRHRRASADAEPAPTPGAADGRDEAAPQTRRSADGAPAQGGRPRAGPPPGAVRLASCPPRRSPQPEPPRPRHPTVVGRAQAPPRTRRTPASVAPLVPDRGIGAEAGGWKECPRGRADRRVRPARGTREGVCGGRRRAGPARRTRAVDPLPAPSRVAPIGSSGTRTGRRVAGPKARPAHRRGGER